MSRRGALRERARALFPKSGKCYELFDSAVLVGLIVGIGYVIEQPGENQRAALGFLEQTASLSAWGAVLTGCAVVAAVFAYVPCLVRYGYAVLIGGCVLWCTAFLAGMLFFDGSARSIPSAIVYGWVVSRLVRVGRS